jgi:hypothetical protein
MSLPKKFVTKSKSSRTNKIVGVVAAFSVAIVGFTVFTSMAAGSATMYVTPSSGTYSPNATIAVAVRINTQGEDVNAVQADLTYNASRLEFQSIDTSGTAFGIEAVNTGGSGTVNISRGSITDVNGDVLVATVNFKVLNNAGSATISFAGTSAIVRTSDQVDVSGTKTGANFTVSGTGGSVQVYRMANWMTKERLFTLNAVERDSIKDKNGWVFEGVAFNVPSGGSIPVYRMANWKTKERLFTLNAVERDTIKDKNGWVYEGVAFSVDAGGSVPVYRLANWITKERLFTLNAVEKDAINNKNGWIYEQVAFSVN